MAMASPQPRHFHFAFPDKTREAEHRLVQGVENCTCYQVQPRSFLRDRSPFGVLHYADCRDFHLDPARASASWNHRMQTTMGFPPTISPVPVQPAPGSPNTCRTGMMPRPPANRSDEPPSAEPAPAPSKAVAADDVPHDEQDGPITRIKFLESKHKKLCREIGKLRGSIFAQRAASEHLIRGKSDLCK
jgi:hypothetical protein